MCEIAQRIPLPEVEKSVQSLVVNTQNQLKNAKKWMENSRNYSICVLEILPHCFFSELIGVLKHSSLHRNRPLRGIGAAIGKGDRRSPIQGILNRNSRVTGGRPYPAVALGQPDDDPG